MDLNLNQITISSRDVARSVAFYKLLGLRLIVDSIPRYARLECPAGDSTFSVHVAEKVEPDSVALYFESVKVDEVVEALIHQGIRIDSMPEDMEWGWREARLKDPDGHHLVIYHAGRYRKDPPWKVGK